MPELSGKCKCGIIGALLRPTASIKAESPGPKGYSFKKLAIICFPALVSTLSG